MFAKFYNDESGIVALEYLLLATVVGLALVVGFSNLASALNIEYSELANAILGLDQSYSYEAASGCSGSHGGSTISDTLSTISYGQSANVTPTLSVGNVLAGNPGCP